MGPISIILAPSLPRQNTTVAAPQTLPWFWLDPGILLAVRMLTGRAGAPPSPPSPTCQHAEANMKSKSERSLCFLLLLFLCRRARALEIRHGAVVAFDLWTRPYCSPLAQGHYGRLGSSASPSVRVHHSLICRSARACSAGRAMIWPPGLERIEFINAGPTAPCRKGR